MVTERLTALTRLMRAEGARAGMGRFWPGTGRSRPSTRPRARTPTTRCGLRCARLAPSWPRSTPPSPPCSRRRSPTSRPCRSRSSPRCRRPRCPGEGARASRALGRGRDRAGPGGMERSGAAADEGLRRDQRRRARGRARPHHPPGAAGAAPDQPPHAPHPAPARAARPARDRARVAAPRRRADGAPLPHPDGASAPPRARLRRLRLDGALRADAPQYLQACVAARRRVEAFVFGTRLTRLTRELAGRDPSARCSVPPTTCGHGRRHAHRRFAGRAQPRARRRMGRGSIVVILSDGWDRATRTSWPRRWRACGAARTA